MNSIQKVSGYDNEEELEEHVSELNQNIQFIQKKKHMDETLPPRSYNFHANTLKLQQNSSEIIQLTNKKREKLRKIIKSQDRIKESSGSLRRMPS